MKIPFASLLLSFLLIGTYYSLSNGTFYIPDDYIRTLGFQLYSQPLGFLPHMFIHVGILHLIGNLLPLVFFALLLESALSSIDVLLIFFSSGIVSGFLFSLLNTNSYLVGASAAISGLMAGATALKPKKALVLLICLPLVLMLLFFPLFQFLSRTILNN